jgi:hypothetical protein
MRQLRLPAPRLPNASDDRATLFENFIGANVEGPASLGLPCVYRGSGPSSRHGQFCSHGHAQGSSTRRRYVQVSPQVFGPYLSAKYAQVSRPIRLRFFPNPFATPRPQRCRAGSADRRTRRLPPRSARGWRVVVELRRSPCAPRIRDKLVTPRRAAHRVVLGHGGNVQEQVPAGGDPPRIRPLSRH